MGYYDEVYLKRLNRYGIDFQSRLQTQRERLFEFQLQKSLYYVNFEYNGEIQEGELTPKSQDERQVLQYLLTRVSLNIPNGTIIMVPDKDGIKQPWMIYYLESIKASGYNRYIVLKMTYYVTWKSRDGEVQHSWAYLYGQENNMLRDDIKSRSRMDVIYTENLKSSFFVMPRNEKLRKDDYLVIGTDELKEGYRVTGYDINSSPGVEYVTIDPMYLKDLTPPPEKTEKDSDDDFFWLTGGEE